MTPSAQIYISGDHFSTLTFIIYQHKAHSKLLYFDNVTLAYLVFNAGPFNNIAAFNLEFCPL